MFGHVKVGVRDFTASKTFYLKAFEPFGVVAAGEGVPTCGIEIVRPRGSVCLILHQTDERPAHLHIAFAAERREQPEVVASVAGRIVASGAVGWHIATLVMGRLLTVEVRIRV